jgi:polysaccharide chain length determinant protein (PEP-CTERM system associated)
MHEILQEVIAILRSMWRYRWYAMGLTWIIAIAGWVVIMRMPDQFTASARVNVNTESVLRPLMRGLTIEPNVQQRLSLMSRTLLSRPNLEKLARMSDLDIKANTPQDLDSLLNNLVGNIRLKQAGREVNFYSLEYTSTNPKLAKDVVQNLLTILSENTLGQSRENSDAAQRFLHSQVKEYETKLNEASKKLDDFKRENHALMPTLSQGYYASLQETEKLLDESTLQLQEATRTRDELKRQIRGEEPVFGIASDPASAPMFSSAIDSRIQELEKQRDELLLKYTKHHPQVVSIDDTIAALKKRKAEELANKGAVAVTPLEQNPVYQQIRLSIAQAEANVSGLQVRVREYQKKERKLKEMIDQLPEVESQLKQLQRDYDQARQRYTEFTQRQETAKLSEEVEQAGEGVQVKIVDPPHVPTNPTGPKRFLFNSAILLLSLGAGIGLAFLLSQIKPVILDTRNLRKLTGLPVYGSVSRIWTPELRKKKKIEYGGYVLVCLSLFAVYSALLKVSI